MGNLAGSLERQFHSRDSFVSFVAFVFTPGFLPVLRASVVKTAVTIEK
jgi:hypothetical protein